MASGFLWTSGGCICLSGACSPAIMTYVETSVCREAVSLVSSRDMTMAFGLHSAVSAEMGTFSLRDYKSSKKLCNSAFQSLDLVERVQEQLM